MSEDPSVHIPTKATIPADEDMGLDRMPLPKPGDWQDGVRVRNKKTGEEGWCRRVDHATRQFRLVGESRTSWRAFDEYDPIVEPSAEDLARDKAKADLEAEYDGLTAEQAAIVQVLADDPDPIKALAKIRALRSMGMMAKPAPTPGKGK